MITLSTITVPVLLETSTHPPQLLHQWARTYHYGHISLPSISIVTAILYFYIAAYQGARKQPWRKAALVGLLTIIMVPFTWIVMSSTNGMLFGLEAGNRDYSQLFEQSAGQKVLKGSNASQSHVFGNVGVDVGVGMATLEGVRGLLFWGWGSVFDNLCYYFLVIHSHYWASLVLVVVSVLGLTVRKQVSNLGWV
ncbi:hypothetical protein BDW72DRAFT_194014 [Aspergillus terricola var. indicus]